MLVLVDCSISPMRGSTISEWVLWRGQSGQECSLRSSLFHNTTMFWLVSMTLLFSLPKHLSIMYLGTPLTALWANLFILMGISFGIVKGEGWEAAGLAAARRGGAVFSTGLFYSKLMIYFICIASLKSGGSASHNLFYFFSHFRIMLFLSLRRILNT